MHSTELSAPMPFGDPMNPSSRLGGEMLAWRPALASADRDMIQREPEAARARQLQLRDPYGMNATRVYRESVIGSHFRLSLKPDADFLGISDEQAEEYATLVEREFERYAEGHTFDSDASRVNTFTQLMAICASSILVNGEMVAILQWKPGPLGYNTCLNIIEPERVSTPYTRQTDMNIRYGIEIDEHHAPLAYYIRKRHPSDMMFAMMQPADQYVWERVPRYTDWYRPLVLHAFDQTRPTQVRGHSPFAAVARQMRMLGDFNEATLEKQIIQASFAAVIESELDVDKAFEVAGITSAAQAAEAMSQLTMGKMAAAAQFHQASGGVKFHGSRVPHLVPGEKLNVVGSGSGSVDYKSFEKALLKQLSAGLGISYESLSRDFSDTSYSAARLSLHDIWRTFMIARTMVTKKIAMPYVAAWLEEAILAGRIPMPNGKRGNMDMWLAQRHGIVRGSFLSAGRPIVDPQKEMEGIRLGLALGLTTLEDEVAMIGGRDWKDIMRQRGREAKEREAEGLNVSGGIDPSLVIGNTPPPPKPTSDAA